MGVYSVHLVGEASYQAAIEKLTEGEPVSIEHEPGNRYDPNALRVAAADGGTIGYIARDSWVQRAFHDEGTAMSARVEAVIGGERGKPTRGVIIEVRTALHAEERADAPPPAVGTTRPARRIRWWHLLLWAFLAFVALRMCMGPEGGPSTSSGRTEEGAGVVGEPVDVTGAGMFAVSIGDRATPAAITAAARAACDGRTHCTVMGWPEGTALPAAFPMIEREVESQIYSYTLNRTTNYERELWDCARWPQGADACL